MQLDAKVTGNISVVVDEDKQTDASVLQIGVKSYRSNTMMASPDTPQGSPNTNIVHNQVSKLNMGMGVPQKLASMHNRLVQRRTSDFFAEALESYDNFQE